jgi:hypothetical protein
VYERQAFKRLIVSFVLNRKITIDVENKPVSWFSQEMEVKNFPAWGGYFDSSVSKVR